MNSTISDSKVITGEGAFQHRMEEVMASVDLHHIHLRDYLYRLTRQWQDAEDILQELWRYVLLYFPEEKIGSLSLLRRKGYQLFVDHYRAAKRRPEILSEELPEIAGRSATQTSFSDAGEAELKQRFWAEFHGVDLTEEQKNILWLHARYGLTYQEVEQKTGVPSSTVGDWVALGRARLAEYLNDNTN
jgi:RNA polymerase sigma factor (sigma-70 family)